MVGDPKHLSDLDKVEADVRIRCRRCKFEDDWTVAALTRHLYETGGSTVWSEVTRTLRCRRFGCGSADVRAIVVPYARRPANMPRRIGELDRRVVDTALAVLTEIARSRVGATATLEVRLALLVLHRYARDREAAAEFWRRAAIPSRDVNQQLGEPLRRLRGALVQRGWLAPDISVERTRTWPWNSPAPPGWKAQPGCGHEETAGP